MLHLNFRIGVAQTRLMRCLNARFLGLASAEAMSANRRIDDECKANHFLDLTITPFHL